MRDNRSTHPASQLETIQFRHRLPHVSLALLALLAVWLIAIANQPRMADGQLDVGEASVLETALIMTTVFSVLASWGLALFKAIGNGHGWWAIGVFVFWPLSYPYLFLKHCKARSCGSELER